MPNPFRELLFGNAGARRDLVEAITPRRTFADVVLPATTRRALEHALVQIEKHDLIFNQWGLAERHNSGLGLAFNFAGPPGTGKTICAEALANALGRKLLLVRYAEMESMWAGNTPKNVAAVFRAAEEEDAVLFFDEADAIAGRRFTSMDQGYQRESNTTVSVLLRELEQFPGVVIFATNLAANFDPAFERRIRTHILFGMPNAQEREQIWQVQLHPYKTPLADDVDFGELADAFATSGGDIKNAVLKAAQMAIAEPGADAEKRIHQNHFIEAMHEVLAAKNIMGQSLYGENGDVAAAAAMGGAAGAVEQLVQSQDSLQGEMAELIERLDQVDSAQRDTTARMNTVRADVEATRAEMEQTRTAAEQGAAESRHALEIQRERVAVRMDETAAALRGGSRAALAVAVVALLAALGALALAAF